MDQSVQKIERVLQSVIHEQKKLRYTSCEKAIPQKHNYKKSYHSIKEENISPSENNIKGINTFLKSNNDLTPSSNELSSNGSEMLPQQKIVISTQLVQTLTSLITNNENLNSAHIFNINHLQYWEYQPMVSILLFQRLFNFSFMSFKHFGSMWVEETLKATTSSKALLGEILFIPKNLPPKNITTFIAHLRADARNIKNSCYQFNHATTVQMSQIDNLAQNLKHSNKERGKTIECIGTTSTVGVIQRLANTVISCNLQQTVRASKNAHKNLTYSPESVKTTVTIAVATSTTLPTYNAVVIPNYWNHLITFLNILDKNFNSPTSSQQINSGSASTTTGNNSTTTTINESEIEQIIKCQPSFSSSIKSLIQHLDRRSP
ncbi:hypothetical protein ACTFIU_002702 [Dictyostelium citrinum]